MKINFNKTAMSLFKTAIIGCLFASNVHAAKQEVKVGAVFPMTGPQATFGQESVNGMKMALETINKAGVNGKVIKVIFEDDKGEPVEAANAVRKLIHVDKVSAVLGSVASSNTLAGAPIAQESKVPLITPASTNEAVTKKGDFISRTCFTDDFQGVVMAKFAYESLNKKKAVIIVDNSSDYSKGLAKVFRAKFTELGGQITASDFAYQQKDTDFRTLLRKLKRENPEVIFLPGYYTEAGLILKQAREMGLDIPFLGGDGWDSPTLQSLAGDAIKGNYISSHFAADDSDPKVQTFVKNYQKRFKQKPGAMAALGYDVVLVLADALKRTKAINTEDLKMAINSTKNFQGVTGLITIDENRNARKSAVVLETTTQGNVFKQKVSP